VPRVRRRRAEYSRQRRTRCQTTSAPCSDKWRVLKSSEATAVAGVRGQATTQQVVEAVMAAEQTLQAGVAIRDKVVSAYLEVSHMAI
jgi:flagellar hook-basal body complex protein FliE